MMMMIISSPRFSEDPPAPPTPPPPPRPSPSLPLDPPRAVPWCCWRLDRVQVKLESAAEESTALQEQESLSLKQLEADGKALATLTATDKKSGLGGRTLITFERFRGGVASPLPAHRMSNGDIVALRDTSAAGPASQQRASDHRGLIYKATEAKLVIAVRRDVSAPHAHFLCEEFSSRWCMRAPRSSTHCRHSPLTPPLPYPPHQVEGERAEELDGTFHVFKAANDVTYKRYRTAMSSLKDAKQGPSGNERRVPPSS